MYHYEQMINESGMNMFHMMNIVSNNYDNEINSNKRPRKLNDDDRIKRR